MDTSLIENIMESMQAMNGMQGMSGFGGQQQPSMTDSGTASQAQPQMPNMNDMFAFFQQMAAYEAMKESGYNFYMQQQPFGGSGNISPYSVPTVTDNVEDPYGPYVNYGKAIKCVFEGMCTNACMLRSNGIWPAAATNGIWSAAATAADGIWSAAATDV